MTQVFTVPATDVLLEEFIPQIRQGDKEEVEVVSGATWEEHSKDIFQYKNEAEVIYCGDKLIGVLGVRPLYPNSSSVGLAWLLLTDHVETNQMAFLRWSRVKLQSILEHYDVLTNVVYMKNDLHVNWLNWLGATWVKTEGDDFGIFTIKKGE